jgi:sugar lactone lactonase YvrE
MRASGFACKGILTSLICDKSENVFYVMKSRLLLSLVIFLLVGFSSTFGQNYDTNNPVVQTFVGSGFYGYLDGQGTQTMFNNPVAVVADSSSNLFVLDTGNARIRKVTPNGNVSTFVGGGFGALPGYGTNVSLSQYSFGAYATMVIDRDDTLWINAISGSAYLLRIGSDGYVSRSNPGLSLPGGLAVDSANNLYISDYGALKIFRFRTNGTLETFVGSGNGGSVDGNGIFTSFNYPTAMTVDQGDNVYVFDAQTIRKINQNRDVTTIAGQPFVYSDVDGLGTGARFNTVNGLGTDNSGNVFIVAGQSIRRLSIATNVSTVAGSFSGGGYANGPGSQARFGGARGVCFSQGMLFVADTGNQRIRSIAFDPSPQVVSGANLSINTYPGVTITGVIGRTYQIQRSPDALNWTPYANVLLSSNPYLWFDQNPVANNRFYRALLLP